MFRLDMSVSRSSETSSPRRQFAQKQEWGSSVFFCSLRQKHQIPNLFLHAAAQNLAQIQPHTQFTQHKHQFTPNHAIRVIRDDFYMKLKKNS